MAEAFSWSEGNRLVNDLGSEDWVARRIELERKARNMSQAQLSKAMEAVGSPLHQSAISKIESPPKGEGKRSITIGETIGFSRVFGIPLGELLLPPETVSMVSALKLLANGPTLYRARMAAETEYDRAIEELTKAIRSDPAVRAVWMEQSASAAKKIKEAGTDPNDSILLSFYADLAASESKSASEASADE